MKAIQKLKIDLYHVFVKGDADKTEMARVFLLLAVPFTAVMFAFGQAAIY